MYGIDRRCSPVSSSMILLFRLDMLSLTRWNIGVARSLYFCLENVWIHVRMWVRTYVCVCAEQST